MSDYFLGATLAGVLYLALVAAAGYRLRRHHFETWKKIRGDVREFVRFAFGRGHARLEDRVLSVQSDLALALIPVVVILEGLHLYFGEDAPLVGDPRGATVPPAYVPFLASVGAPFLIGLGLVSYAIAPLLSARKARNWLVGLGELEHCELVETLPGRSGRRYYVEVRYRYSVGGRTYRGERYAFGYRANSDYRKHQDIYIALRGARRLQVRYDPADPSRAVVSCEPMVNVALALFGAGMVGVAVVTFVLAHR